MTKLNVLVYDSIAVNLLEMLSSKYDVKVFKYSEGIGSRELKKIDLALFHGEQRGHVHPDLYSEAVGKFTDLKKDSYFSKYDTLRSYSRFSKIPRLGIEEGAHYLTVNAGGSLIQYVNGHQKEHPISTHYGGSILVPSDHSQMMYPFGLPSNKYQLRAWSSYFESTTYLNGKNQERVLDSEFLEPEVVLYTNDAYNALAVQGNPMLGNLEYKKYILDEIDNLLKMSK